jgi:hypothetical protein
MDLTLEDSRPGQFNRPIYEKAVRLTRLDTADNIETSPTELIKGGSSGDTFYETGLF